MKAIALHDAAAFRASARRTAAVRSVLGLALVTLLVFAWLAARDAHASAGRLIPNGSSPVVVLDLSKSTAGWPYSELAGETLRTLTDRAGNVGLVAFSDQAYELMPPGTPAAELRKLLPFFRQVGKGRAGPLYPPNPWAGDFTSGTRIANGLEEARLALARAGAKHGSVILVSDLDDGVGDPVELADSVLRLRRSGISIRVVPLAAKPQLLELWTLLVGKAAIVSPPMLDARSGTAGELPAKGQTEKSQSGMPVLLLTLSALLLVCLGANELFSSRLELTS